MRIRQRSNLKTGSDQILDLKEFDILYISTAEELMLTFSDMEGEIVEAMKVKGNQRIRINQDIHIKVDCEQFTHWGYDIGTSREVVDPVPVELESDRTPETMEEKLFRMVGEAAMNMYGKDSEEIETLEEALDFDINMDGDVGILSGLEVIELADEAPLPPQEASEAAPSAASETNAPDVPTSEQTPQNPPQ